MVKLNKIKILGIFIFIFIAGGLLYAINFSNNTPSTSEEPVENAEFGTMLGVDTSDWLVYENKEYGYRFKYPKNLEVVDGKDPQFSFYELPKATFITLPAKYPNIKDPNYKDPRSFVNYQIVIQKNGERSQFGTNLEEIIQNLAPTEKEDVLWEKYYEYHKGREEDFRQILKNARINEAKEVINANKNVIIAFKDRASVYIIGENDVYALDLRGSNPKDQYVEGWLKDINNPQLTEWVNNYSDYTRVLEGIYSTFEIF